ncbi:carboxypeptidase regulatory-like domain-containing protein [Acidicapsa dinghuensis]|uniref:Carboxypeptidase regulatory-like domain-containing protein n=1 Tax=Acidicapsa dinghuensis TaxID=2218256 RepID=A0ABW1E936_9BACT|nr:TonB-dependent receptor [Acidicapsa dinghuensis]
MMKRMYAAIVMVMLLVGWCCLPVAMGQTVSGSITGTVTDTSDAAVPGAQVTAHAVETGVDTAAATNETGFFRIVGLPIGHYTVTVKASEFNSQALPEFSLEAVQVANFNVKLTVGGGTETVSVSAAAPILNTNDLTLQSTFTENTISNLPLNGLDFSALTLYLPGAVNTAGTSGPTSIERSTYFTDSINLNGNRAQANNYTLDGIDMNETFNNLISYSPAPAALAEVDVVTADSPVTFGNVNGGGVVNVLKSGTNHFHGSAYGYVQDYRLNANSWQNNNKSPIIPINPYSQDQFGGTFGGPILHDKLFFFVDYLGSRYHTGGTGSDSVFPQAMRNGDFSVLLAGDNPVHLYDTLNNYAPYANNQGVPVVNPVAKFLFANPSLYPLPNATPTDGIANSNYQAPTRSYKANNQGDIKIEYDWGPKDKLTGFYSMSTAYDGSTPVLPISFPGVNLYPTKLSGATWVHTFSPNLINTGRIGFTRTVWAQNFPTDPTGKFGTTGNQVVGISFPSQSFDGYTYQSISGGLFAGGNPVYGGGLIDNTYSYIDNITWEHGHHVVTAGVQALRYQNNYPTANNDGYLGSLGYNGNFSSDPSVANSGYGGADFLLDRVSTAAVTLASVNVGQRQWRVAEFVNDDYRVLPNLTLNLGVRWELDEPWAEQNNKTGNVDETTGQVLYAHAIPAGVVPPGSGLCSNRGCYDWSFHQIVPRFGFAYQPTPRSVIRGGYSASSFFEGNSSNQRLTSITPFIQAINININGPSSSGIPAPRTAEEGFTGNISYGGTYNVYPKNIQPAYVQEWNLTTEYAVTPTLSLQVGYLGEQGQHIEDYGDLNQYTVNGDPTSAPFYNSPYIGVNTPAATAVGSGVLLVTESRAMMNYNALQVVLRQRQWHGLEYTFNYTYGKAMTNSLGNYALNVNGYSGAFQNYYDSAADYGPAGYDIKHNISATGVYALPLGRGQQFLPNTSRALDEVVGGWKLSTALVGYTGFPETMSSSTSNNSGNPYGVERANQYRKMRIVHQSIDHWFGDDPSAQPCTTPGVDNGVCAFGAPATNTFGTSRNGAVRGPGYFNADLSAFKDFHIVESQTIGFRFDAFNAFNIVSYGNPDTGINNTTFGYIAQQNSIRSQERHLQFSLHYNF